MKKSNIIFSTVIILLMVMCIAISAFSLSPRFRVSMFVFFNGERLERAIESNEGMPIIGGVDAMNFWGDGMDEFILFIIGSRYYGCYYSHSGEPFAFQGVSAELVKTGENLWEWRLDGNHGETSRICGNWYYFEAIF